MYKRQDKLGATEQQLDFPVVFASGLNGWATLEQLAVMSEQERDATLLAADTLLADWPAVRLDDDDAGRFLSGVRRRLPLADAPHVRVYGPQPQAFLGSGHIAAGELISNRLLSPVEVQGLLQRATP